MRASRIGIVHPFATDILAGPGISKDLAREDEDGDGHGDVAGEGEEDGDVEEDGGGVEDECYHALLLVSGCFALLGFACEEKE